MSDLHGQTNIVTVLDDTDRIAAGKPGQEGAKNIEYRYLRDQINNSIAPKIKTFSTAIDIAEKESYSTTQTLTPSTTITFTKGTGTYINGVYQVVLTCDNNNIEFDAGDFEESTSNITGVSGRVWLIFAVNPDGKLGVAQYGSGGTGLPQLLAPTLDSVVATSSTELTANWTDNNISPNEASFTLEYDTVNTFDSVNFGEITGIAADSVSQLIGSLTASTLYYVRVKAIGDGTTVADSPYSNVLSQTTAAENAPTVTTQAVTDITATTATGNGNIASLGDTAVTAHGFVWSTNPNPTLSDSSVDNGTAGATGAFTGAITGLTDGLTYYVRAFATNSAGTSYGNEVSFVAEDAAVFEIVGMTFDANNDYADVEFSQGAYGGAGGGVTGPDLDISFLKNATGNQESQSALSVTKTDGNPTLGGETVIRLNLGFSGIPNGNETLEVKPISNSSIKNISNEYLTTSDTTGAINYNSRFTGNRVVWSNVTNANVVGELLTSTALNGGANDSNVIAAGTEGFIIAKAGTSMVFGLAQGDSHEGWQDLDYAIFEFNAGRVYAYSNGVQLGNTPTSVVTVNSNLMKVSKEHQGGGIYDIVFSYDADGLSGFVEFHRESGVSDVDLYVKCSTSVSGKSINFTVKN